MVFFSSFGGKELNREIAVVCMEKNDGVVVDVGCRGCLHGPSSEGKQHFPRTKPVRKVFPLQLRTAPGLAPPLGVHAEHGKMCLISRCSVNTIDGRLSYDAPFIRCTGSFTQRLRGECADTSS